MSWPFAVLAAALFAAACQARPEAAAPASTSPADAAGYTNVVPACLAEMLASQELLLINTHTPYAGEIPQTDLFIPYDQVEDKLDRLPADKNAPIVLYCRSGRMSAIAADTLSRLGFTNLFNLDGGMLAWEQAGFAIEGE